MTILDGDHPERQDGQEDPARVPDGPLEAIEGPQCDLDPVGSTAPQTGEPQSNSILEAIPFEGGVRHDEEDLVGVMNGSRSSAIAPSDVCHSGDGAKNETKREGGDDVKCLVETSSNQTWKHSGKIFPILVNDNYCLATPGQRPAVTGDDDERDVKSPPS